MKWFGIIAAVIGATVVGYRMACPSLTMRYRLTLEAQVNGDPKVGSSVVEVTYSKQSRFAGQSDLIVGHRGEAVALDLGGPGKLFALLRAGSDSRSIPETMIFRAFDFDGGAFPGKSVEDGLAQLQHLTGKRDLPMASLPMLVHFRNPNDMRSVEQVDPMNIGRTFGADVRLVKATVEIVPSGVWPLNLIGMTGEPVTVGIEGALPWWNGPFPWLKPLGGGVYADDRHDAFKVNKEDFKFPPK